jgi:AraC family transcriptional regulator
VSEEDRQPASKPAFTPKLQDRVIQQLITLLLEEIQAGAPSGKLYVESLVHALAVRFVFLGENSQRHEVRQSASALPPAALRRVLDLIEESFQNELSLVSLAKETGYSRGHFVRMFRRATGVTPHQYVLRRRVDHARFLLNQPKGISLIEVAASCGFSHQTHLTRVFREHVGVTPGGYRRDQDRLRDRHPHTNAANLSTVDQYLE